MEWGIKLSKPVERWLDQLDNDGLLRVCAALDVLGTEGPRIGRPLVHRTHDPCEGRELRIAGPRGRELRVRFTVDADGYSVLLTGLRPNAQRPGRHSRACPAGDDDAGDDPGSYVEWSQLRPLLDLDEPRILHYRSRLRSELAGERLAEARKGRLLTRAEVAFAMGVRTSRVDRIEAGGLERAPLGRLRAYVQSLGGHVEVAATFSDRRILL